jgi:hypothetical protein
MPTRKARQAARGAKENAAPNNASHAPNGAGAAEQMLKRAAARASSSIQASPGVASPPQRRIRAAASPPRPANLARRLLRNKRRPRTLGHSPASTGLSH